MKFNAVADWIRKAFVNHSNAAPWRSELKSAFFFDDKLLIISKSPNGKLPLFEVHGAPEALKLVSKSIFTWPFFVIKCYFSLEYSIYHRFLNIVFKRWLIIMNHSHLLNSLLEWLKRWHSLWSINFKNNLKDVRGFLVSPSDWLLLPPEAWIRKVDPRWFLYSYTGCI